MRCYIPTSLLFGSISKAFWGTTNSKSHSLTFCSAPAWKDPPFSLRRRLHERRGLRVDARKRADVFAHRLRRHPLAGLNCIPAHCRGMSRAPTAGAREREAARERGVEGWPSRGSGSCVPWPNQHSCTRCGVAAAGPWACKGPGCEPAS